MPVVTAFFMSVMLFIAFTGSSQLDWNLRRMNHSLHTPVRTYVPPERKSVIVNAAGQAQPIAGLTYLVKRDRSQTVYRSREMRQTPKLDVMQDDFQVAATPAAAPLARPAAPLTISGTLVRETGLIDTDDSFLTESDRLLTNRVRQAILDDNALYIVSMHVRVKTVNGSVILTGEVSTPHEKEVIGAKASRIAGAANVKNNLDVLVGG